MEDTLPWFHLLSRLCVQHPEIYYQGTSHSQASTTDEDRLGAGCRNPEMHNEVTTIKKKKLKGTRNPFYKMKGEEKY